MLLLLLITPGRNRDKPIFPRFQGNNSQEPLQLLYQKPVFDFTVGRLSENVKVLPQWIYDFCLQQRCTRRWSSNVQCIPHLSDLCPSKGLGIYFRLDFGAVHFSMTKMYCKCYFFWILEICTNHFVPKVFAFMPLCFYKLMAHGIL